ncbi:alpha 1,2-mannosyltransferase, partial [Tremellales sp. Uapishka_1]
MKPVPHSVPSEKQSAFFSSPYNPSSASSSSSYADTQSPLLPFPASLEKGSFSFPSMRPDFLTRARILVAGKANMARGAIWKRVFLVAVFFSVGVLIYHHDSEVNLFQNPTYDFESSDAVIPSEPKKFRIPFLSPPSSPPPLAPTSLRNGLREIDIASEPLPVEANLRERLDAWKNAPGGRGEITGEVELGGFVKWNIETCDTIHEQHNTHMIQKSANVWATMDRRSLHENRMKLIDHMEYVLAKNLTAQYGEGRGIVLVAGNADTLQRVKWSLQMLRSYGSTLPVQIVGSSFSLNREYSILEQYHFPSEAPGDDIRAELRELGGELVEAKGQEKDEGKNKSYHLKAIAVIQAPWQEVLYLDSDSIPTRDPEYMFDAPNYKRLGLWATPDYWKTSANNPIWAIIGVKCRNEWEMETGQMFIDKKRHLDVFLLIKFMLENHEWWFFFSDGDKDIFRWAMLALRKRWGVPGRWVGAAALPSGTASGDFCAHTMLQHDSWGEPLFVHYNLLKQIPSGVGRGFSWGRTKQLPLFNTFPADPSTARLGEPTEAPVDNDRPGLGDIDCDMLADADEHGVARSPAQEMVMRRAVRERGVKVKYHGGWISALCIDLEYIDPRSEERREEDKNERTAREEQAMLRKSVWEAEVARAAESGEAEPPQPEHVEPVYPDWEKSPIEVVQWRDDQHLVNFESKIYDLGFKPSGPGF